MKKTRELIAANLKAIDVVVEIIDARIPVSSRNPIIGELCAGKQRVIVLGKYDLADETATKQWRRILKDENEDVFSVVPVNSMTGEGSKELMKTLEQTKSCHDTKKIKNDSAPKGDHDANDGATTGSVRLEENRPLRLMVVGVPNVGKSSFINRMTGKKSAQVGNRPGVTKGKQWLTLKNGMQLLDTPGILWPKFEDPKVGLDLAFCGSIKDEILDSADLALELIKVLQDGYPEMLKERYKLDELSCDALENMEAIAEKRGFIMAGKRIDYERTARTILDEFRAGKIGRITLELPGDQERNSKHMEPMQ